MNIKDDYEVLFYIKLYAYFNVAFSLINLYVL
jgi:hypothetical protein